MLQSLSGTRKTSYVLMALGFLGVGIFHLGGALIAGLFAFMLLDETQHALRGAGASPRAARWSSVGLFVIVLALLAIILTSFVRIGLTRLPLLLDNALHRLGDITGRHGFDLPVDNVQELRALILDNVKSNAHTITSASGLLTRDFFHIVLAMVVAVLRFISLDDHGADPEPKGRGLDEDLRREFFSRAALFSRSFERVMGAQIMIAGINAVLSAAFLFALQIPFRTMLTLAAFLFGLIPIVGNLISNTLIVAAALTVSDNRAIAALIFLIVIHKGGYFVYGRIAGARMDMSTWSILIGVLAGEALMGAAGVILAPTVIYYVREELRAVPAR